MRFRLFSTLRDYQQECIKKSLDSWKNGSRRIAVSLPVGSGKTVIFSNLIRNLEGKVMVLAHRKELLVQAFLQIQKFCPDLV
jgi:ATP-dependent helicase IRC3